MTELATPASHEEPRYERFFNRGDSLASISKDLERAISRGDLSVARALSPLQMEIEERRGVSVSLARSYLRNSSLATFEAVQTLQQGREIDAELGEELDLTYQDIAEHIAVLVRERKSLPMHSSSYYKRVRQELTGGITELTTLALPSRLGQYANMLLTPSSTDEDEAGADADGMRFGIDFKGYLINPVFDIHNPIDIQLKTGKSDLHEYAPSILPIALNQLTPSPAQAYDALPRAIVRDARGESSLAERKMISYASMLLLRRAVQHHSDMQEQATQEM